MKDWEEKRKLKSVLYSKPVLAFLVLLLVLALKGTWNLYQKSEEAAANREMVLAQIAELQKREDFLKQGLDRLSTKEGVEAQIRQKFDVKKEGEEVAVIIVPERESDDVVKGRVASFFGRIITGFGDIFR